MFNFLNKSKFNTILPSTRFHNTIPIFKLLANFQSEFDQLSHFNITEMYLECNHLIILSENGTIFISSIFPNTSPHKLIKTFSTQSKIAKSISINKKSQSLLIIYLNQSNSTLAELKCVSIPLIQLFSEEGPLPFIELFTTENLTSPAFVEFDETNQKIITRNSLSVYKIWDMTNYKLIFELSDRRIEEIRTSDGLLMSIRIIDESDNIQLSVYDIDNGKLIINYLLEMAINYDLEILEIFDKVLLIKQESHPPIILNLIDLSISTIKNENLDENSQFIFCNKMNLFLALNKNVILFYNIKGEEVKSIRNDNINLLMPNCIQVSYEKNYLIVYWENKKDKNLNRFKNVSDITPLLKSKKSKIFSESDFKFSCSMEKVKEDEKLNSSFKKFFNSSIVSKIEKDNESQFSFNEIFEYEKDEVFVGELELICLNEEIESKITIDARNSKFILNESFPSITNDKISYFTFDQKSMRIYLIMQSGLLFECSV